MKDCHTRVPLAEPAVSVVVMVTVNVRWPTFAHVYIRGGDVASGYESTHVPYARTILRRCRRGNFPAGWRNAPALNPKMRRGLSVLPVY
jgi:hypothetical protein